MNIEAPLTVEEWVDLPDKQHGWSIPKIQRVAIGALALGTRNPATISLLIGLKEKEVKTIVDELFLYDWAPMEVLEEVQHYERVDTTMNEDLFPILKKKGVKV